MAQEHRGGCHCGSVKFSITENPELTFFCHCNDCQRTTGSPFSVELMIADTGFEITGKLSDYVVTGDSGKDVHRRSCAKCGSGIHLECDSDPGYVFVKAGAFDDASWVKPDMHIFTAAKQPWVKIDDGLPQYPGMPED